MIITNFSINYDIISLTSKAVAVLNNLIFRSNSKTNSCFPGLKTIAKECKISVRSVQRGLDELLEAGIIQKKHNYRANGSQTTNIYTIILKAEERVIAAKENAMQKINDMRKRIAQKKENDCQVKMDLADVSAKNEEYPKNSITDMIKKTLKFTYLAMGGSHSDHPITEKINY